MWCETVEQNSSNLKNYLRNLIDSTARHPSLYTHFWHPLGRLTQLAQRTHYWQHLQLEPELASAQELLRSECAVQGGPFAGLRYPSAAATGSSLYPKLVGSYEQELHSIVETLVALQADLIVDIGAAEGYYATGFAIRLPRAEIHAFDIGENAMRMCSSMASENGVADRVHVESKCTPQRLLDLDGRPAVVVSDCEGYEEHLFNFDTARALRRCHLLIECHDFRKPGLTRRVAAYLTSTHHVETIIAVPDYLRPMIFPSQVIRHLSRDVQIALMAELRPAYMNWLYCTPRDNSASELVR